MNLRSQILILGMALSALLSCKKSNDADPVIPPVTVDTPKVVPGVDIYVMGVSLWTNESMGIATYWKNGIPKKINDSLSFSGTSVHSVAVKGKDVYLLGRTNKLIGPNSQETVCWKNGVEIYRFISEGVGLTMQGNDLYFWGSMKDTGSPRTGRYWKNGVATDVKGSAGILALAVKNNDVYVAGFYETKTGNAVAAYWKNGERKVLSADTLQSSYASSVALNGNDVHVGGWNTQGRAMYWKNDVATALSSGITSNVYTVSIIGNDVYCLGAKQVNTGPAIACYWKNGTPVDLITDLTNNKVTSSASNIVVFGNDTYISGRYGNMPALWKNGVLTTYANDKTATYATVTPVLR